MKLRLLLGLFFICANTVFGMELSDSDSSSDSSETADYWVLSMVGSKSHDASTINYSDYYDKSAVPDLKKELKSIFAQASSIHKIREVLLARVLANDQFNRTVYCEIFKTDISELYKLRSKLGQPLAKGAIEAVVSDVLYNQFTTCDYNRAVQSEIYNHVTTNSLSRDNLCMLAQTFIQDAVGWNSDSSNLRNMLSSRCLELIKQLLVKHVPEEIIEDLVRMFSRAGACLNIPDTAGKTMIMYAAEFGKEQLVKLLLDLRVNPAKKDTRGQAAFDYAEIFSLKEMLAPYTFGGARWAIQFNKEPIIRAYIDRHDIDVSDQFGKTLLDYALDFENKRIVEFLLNHGANYKHVNKSGISTLSRAGDELFRATSRAAKYGGCASVIHQYVKDYEAGKHPSDNLNAPINQQNRQTMLIAASRRVLVNIVEQLLELKNRRIVLHVNDIRNRTALSYACEMGSPIVLLQLLEKYRVDDVSASELAQALLTVDDAGDIPLTIATLNPNISADAIRLMLSIASARKQLAHKKNNDLSALHIACQVKRKDVIVLLLANNADINQLDASGRTPLIHAVKSGSAEIVELLIKYGAQTDVRDSANKTAYEYARLRRHKKIQDLLAPYLTPAQMGKDAASHWEERCAIS